MTFATQVETKRLDTIMLTIHAHPFDTHTHTHITNGIRHLVFILHLTQKMLRFRNRTRIRNRQADHVITLTVQTLEAHAHRVYRQNRFPLSKDYNTRHFMKDYILFIPAYSHIPVYQRSHIHLAACMVQVKLGRQLVRVHRFQHRAPMMPTEGGTRLHVQIQRSASTHKRTTLAALARKHIRIHRTTIIRTQRKRARRDETMLTFFLCFF